jgi:hypothetical protein
MDTSIPTILFISMICATYSAPQICDAAGVVQIFQQRS